MICLIVKLSYQKTTRFGCDQISCELEHHIRLTLAKGNHTEEILCCRKRTQQCVWQNAFGFFFLRVLFCYCTGMVRHKMVDGHKWAVEYHTMLKEPIVQKFGVSVAIDADSICLVQPFGNMTSDSFILVWCCARQG